MRRIATGPRVVLLFIILFAVGVALLLRRPADGPGNIGVTAAATPSFAAEDDPPDILIRPFNRSFHVDGRKEWEINAAEARGYKDAERFSLTQIKDSTFVDQAGREFLLSADSGEWEKGRQRFIVTGNVNVEMTAQEGQPALHFQADDLTMDRGRNIITVSSPVKIWRDDMEVTGKSLYGDLLIGSMVIAPDTLTRVMQVPGKSAKGAALKRLKAPLTIVADELSIDQFQERIIYTGGPPKVAYGAITLTADKITYQRSAGESYILASGDVLTTVPPGQLPGAGPEDGAPAEPVIVRAESLIYDLKAQSAILDRSVTIVQGGNSLQGDQLEVFLNETADAATGAILRGNLKILYGAWEGQADQAIYNPERDSLIMTGDPRLGRGDAWIAAEQIHRAMSTGETQFAGNVRGGLSGGPPRPRPGTPAADDPLPMLDSLPGGPPVRFSADRAVYVEGQAYATLNGHVTVIREEDTLSTEAATAFFRGVPLELAYIELPAQFQMTRGEDVLTGDSGTYFASMDRFTVAGDARLWRQDNFIRSDAMEVFPRKGAGDAHGNVQAFLAGQALAPGTPKTAAPSSFAGPTDEPLLVRSDAVHFDDETGSVQFTGQAVAEQGAWTLKAQSMTASLDSDSSSPRSLLANGDVEITDGQMTGTGQALEYAGADRSVVLIGTNAAPAKIIWGARGTQGERIVIYLDERRYVVTGGESMYVPDKTPGTATSPGKPAPRQPRRPAGEGP